MAPLVLVTTALAFGIAVCTAQNNNYCEKSNLLVLTTASQLRKEVRKEVNEALTETLPQLCTSDSQNQTVSQTPSPTNNCTCEDIILAIETLSQLSRLLIPGLTPSYPATSCKEILQLDPHSPSGLYWIRGTDGAAKHMYCDMERSCKGVGGGWMRVASVNMTDSNNSCPSGLRTLTEPRRLCGKNIDGGGCSSAVLPVEGVQYSRVCGKIIGYQQKTPDAFLPYNHRGQRTIDSYYVDGISLTHGSSPRKHIWTFAAAFCHCIPTIPWPCKRVT